LPPRKQANSARLRHIRVKTGERGAKAAGRSPCGFVFEHARRGGNLQANLKRDDGEER
jgi:hypothetical protein